MDAARRALQSTMIIMGLTLMTISPASAPLQAQTVSAQTWETPHSAPGTGQFFQCLYEQRWPCQAATDNAPSVDEILAKYQEALGGASALAKASTRVIMQHRFQDIGTPEDEYLVRYTKKPSTDEGRMLSIMSDTALDGTFLRWVNGCDAQGGYSWYEAEEIRAGFHMQRRTPLMAFVSSNSTCMDTFRSILSV